MIKFLAVLMAILFFTLPVKAQAVLVEADCSELSQKQVAGANYKPGVDVKGKSVKSADLGDVDQPIIYPLVIPVQIDLLRGLDLSAAWPSTLGNLKTDVAYLTLFEDGHVEYNGQDISDRADVKCVSNEKVTEALRGVVLKTAEQNSKLSPPDASALNDITPASGNAREEGEDQPFQKTFKTLINEVTDETNPIP